MSTEPTPRLKMLFFTSKDCGICQSVKRNVLPIFQKKNPGFVIEEIQIGLNEPGKDAQAEARADAYDVQSVPAIFFEVEGLPSGGGVDCTLNGLTQLWKKAEEALKKAGTPS